MYIKHRNPCLILHSKKMPFFGREIVISITHILTQFLRFTVFLRENTVKNHENKPFTVKLP